MTHDKKINKIYKILKENIPKKIFQGKKIFLIIFFYYNSTLKNLVQKVLATLPNYNELILRVFKQSFKLIDDVLTHKLLKNILILLFL